MGTNTVENGTKQALSGEYKTCNKCKQTLSLNNFHRNRNGRLGVADRCKPCAKALAREWYKNNRERGIANSKKSKVRARSNAVTRLYNAAKDRATARGIEFNITPEDIIIPDVCPVLGIAFTYGGGRSHPSSYSLDRIDPKKGYVKGNIQVISRLANSMKSNATKDQLLKFAEWVNATYKEVD